MVNISDKSLLEKYDLQIDQLDYTFIRECKNVKTLERILIVLRSGEEGIFPDLIKFCENRLRELAPNSGLLNPVKRILRYSDLPEIERSEIGNDIQKWSEELKSAELTTDVAEDVNTDLPPIRGKSLKIDLSKKEKTPPQVRSKTKRSSQRSYSEWDKFDVDEELKKLDGREHQETPKQDKKKVKTHSGLSRSVSVSGLSEKEREYVANLEKNKGNEAFKTGQYEEAVIYYTRSLSVLRSTITLNNRAQAYLKLKNYLAAVQDCNEVISLEPNNIKAFYRRGIAYKEEGICDLAKLDFKEVLELDPENKLAKEQLKEVKRLKMPKTSNKKVLIEEVEADECQNVENEEPHDATTEKGTRLKIQEINSGDTVTRLTNLNYSSDEEDDSVQLPQKVKQMLKIDARQNQRKGTPGNVRGHEIDNKPVIESKREDVPKPKIVEIESEAQANSNSELKSSSRQHKGFVNIKIEDCTSSKDPNYIERFACRTETKVAGSEEECEKGIEKNEADDKKIKDSCTNRDKDEVQNRNTMESSNLNNDLLNGICHEECTKLNASLFRGADSSETKSLEKSTASVGEQHDAESRIKDTVGVQSQISEGNNATFVEQKSYEKISPYEFLCTWWSSNAAEDVKVGAEHLLKIHPRELPTVISNKLDTTVLCGLLKAIAGILMMGKSLEGENYLYYLLRVPRIELISMLLSDSEVQSIRHSFAPLEKGTHTTYVNKILQL